LVKTNGNDENSFDLYACFLLARNKELPDGLLKFIAVGFNQRNKMQADNWL
jgi:hypothetical protein